MQENTEEGPNKMKKTAFEEYHQAQQEQSQRAKKLQQKVSENADTKVSSTLYATYLVVVVPLILTDTLTL